MGCRLLDADDAGFDERAPLADEGLGLAVAADAVIDNRRELFRRLGIEPPRQERMSDSELILAAYLAWGEEAPEYLIGDFAFVIWDARRRALFGARDALGSRSLYYADGFGGFAFATAAAPLRLVPGVGSRLSETWLAEFLAIPAGVDAADPHGTPFHGIRQVPPGHSFVFREGRTSMSTFGSPLPKEMLRLKSDGEYEEAFRAVFREAVADRMRTRFPVGAALSGGLDSGSVAAFAARELRARGEELRTYCAVPHPQFEDWTPHTLAADESPFARATAEHAGNVRDVYLAFPEHNAYNGIDRWLDLLDAPYKFIENSVLLSGIYEAARADGTGVMLTGARGNYTISWGSAIEYYAELARRAKLASLVREMRRFGRRHRVAGTKVLPLVLKTAFPSLAQIPFRKFEPAVPPLVRPELAARTGVFERLREHAAEVGLDWPVNDIMSERERYFANRAVLSMQGTTATKLSLAYGIRERDPTADLRLIRFCLSVPVEQYVKGGVGRSLLRRATAGILPDKVRMNVRTRGAQGADWLFRVLPSWPDIVREAEAMLADSAAAGFIDTAKLREMLARTGSAPRPEQAFQPAPRVILRAIVFYRFLKRYA